MQIERITETLICNADDGSTIFIKARKTADDKIIGLVSLERVEYALSVCGVEKVDQLNIKTAKGKKVRLEWRDPNFAAIVKS